MVSISSDFLLQVGLSALMFAFVWGGSQIRINRLEEDNKETNTKIDDLHKEFVSQSVFQLSMQESTRRMERLESDLRDINLDVKEILKVLKNSRS